MVELLQNTLANSKTSWLAAQAKTNLVSKDKMEQLELQTPPLILIRHSSLQIIQINKKVLQTKTEKLILYSLRSHHETNLSMSTETDHLQLAVLLQPSDSTTINKEPIEIASQTQVGADEAATTRVIQELFQQALVMSL